jgi:hypothetical protein
VLNVICQPALTMYSSSKRYPKSFWKELNIISLESWEYC